MTIADFYPNSRHHGVVILLKFNDCYGPDLLGRGDFDLLIQARFRNEW
jgi:hypothetical protein